MKLTIKELKSTYDFIFKNRMCKVFCCNNTVVIVKSNVNIIEAIYVAKRSNRKK